MSVDVKDPTNQTAASLLTGILGDLQDLVEEQFQLTRREIEDEVRQCAAAGLVFAVGMGVLFLAAMILCLGFAHLLHWVGSAPGTDPSWVPLWACHASVAAVLVITGGALVVVGRTRFKSIHRVQNPVTELMQERV